MNRPRDVRPPFSAVRAVLNKHDPEGLLAIGAPENEYDPESEHFARLVRDGKAITRAVVMDVWGHWFGTTGFVRADEHEIDVLAADLDGLRGQHWQ